MAAPFMLAMEHAEWRAGKVLKKHHKNRPLARMEAEHQYTPRQPVLSCRTLHVDLTGTRTYRPRSSNDIIHEQHKLIHDIYAQARNVASSKRRSQQRSSSPSFGSSVLMSITVQGNRPQSASQVERSSPPPAVAEVKHPETAQPCISEDQDIENSTRDLNIVRSIVQTQFDAENHSLEASDLMRGQQRKVAKAGLEPKTNNQWIVFPGGQRSKSAGIVDSFNGMRRKNHTEYFSIDVGSGCQVTKNLRKGEKCYVGVNGQKKQYLKRPQCLRTELSNGREEEGKAEQVVVPLCWSDQVSKASDKVIAPRMQSEKPKLRNLCESHPVIFHHADDEEDAGHFCASPLRTKSQQGYYLKVSVRPRKSMDGHQRVNSHIRNFSFKNAEVDNDGNESITIEEILQTRVSSGKQKKKRPPEKNSNKEESTTEDLTKETVTFENEVNRAVTAPPNIARSFSSFSNLPANKDIESLVVGFKASAPVKPDTRVDRTPSAGRSAKQLSKSKPLPSSGSMQSSKVSRESHRDAEFIQISQQMRITKERAMSACTRTSVQPPTPPLEASTQVIEYVRDHNAIETMKEEDSCSVSRPPADTPPCSRIPSPDFHYAFNIPTGRSTEILSENGGQCA
ncbi:hypothetical protein CAPTEDRAFT_217914 [Capitella teleta]|uniref:Uncharacterized protein n=1 Tax=Capitella teleta TaxID=283909 RepID=R7VAD0_CAPTE|nr:hypothetical protein CAPTEDRAFT_217914 [Capitella teleta]|eukprot:ELU13286.1 hypothetical protein CAPTEDRAFT_217914 [Capitella teleta]